MDFICYFCVFKRYLKSCMMTKRKLLYILAATAALLLVVCNRQRNEADRTHLNKLDSLLAVQPEAAADSLKTFLETPLAHPERGDVTLNAKDPVTIEAQDFSILSPEGKVLAGPLNFTLPAGQRVVLVGTSGSGKSSLLNALSGFMAYTGSLRINKTELRNLDPDAWRKQLSWVGQNPQLPASTLRENVLLARPDAREDELQSVLDRAWVSEFLPQLPQGVDTVVGDQSAGLSVGQAQRVAVARALLNPCQLMLLDEPAASLDAHSEQRVMDALNDASLQQTTLMVTHQLEGIADWDQIWVMENGRIVEQGDYASLVTAQGPFAALLANRQEDI
jgi:ATP-binding cassette subfamily C protein CydD